MASEPWMSKDLRGPSLPRLCERLLLPQKYVYHKPLLVMEGAVTTLPAHWLSGFEPMLKKGLKGMCGSSHTCQGLQV